MAFGRSAIVDVTKMLSMSMFGRKVELSVAEAMKVYGIIGKVDSLKRSVVLSATDISLQEL